MNISIPIPTPKQDILTENKWGKSKKHNLNKFNFHEYIFFKNTELHVHSKHPC